MRKQFIIGKKGKKSKTGKIMGALMLAGALLLSGCARGGSSVSPSDAVAQQAEEITRIETAEDIARLHPRENVVFDGTFRSQLTEDEQKIYDALVQHLVVEKSIDDLTVDVTFFSCEVVQYHLFEEILAYVYRAFCADHPEVFLGK